MATKFLTNIDLNQNQLVNATFEVVGTDPISGNFEGRMIYNSTTDSIKVYGNGAWRAFVNSVAASGTYASALTISESNGAVTLTLNLADTDNAGLLSSDFWDLLNEATSSADVSTLVKRDSSGNISVAGPTQSGHAATKGYVDAARQGLDVKDSVGLASTINIDLSGEPGSVPSDFEIDGVAKNTVATQRFLFKNQTNPIENGIYTTAGGTWVRTHLLSAEPLSGGSFVFVEQGDTQADTGWVVTSDGALTFDEDEILWTQFSGAGSIVAGDGLTQDGNRIDVVGTTDRISVSANAIDIASTYVGQSSITTLGTITTGTWNGTDIAVADGGTGSGTASGARTNLAETSTSGQTTTTPVLARIAKQGCAASIVGVSTTTVTHNYGTTDVMVQVYEVSTGATVICDVTRANSNTVTVVMNGTIAANDYTIVVTG